MDYNIFKSIHLIAVISWTAGLLYIGRLFVYYVDASHQETKQTLAIMAKKLDRFIILPASIIAILIGAHLIGMSNALSYGWFHLKLLLILLVLGYQHMCSKYIKQLLNGTFNKSSLWCRVFNEVPIVLITGLVFAAITKNMIQSIIATSFIFSFLIVFFSIKKFKY